MTKWHSYLLISRKYSISKSHLPKQVTHLSQGTTEWQAKGVDIGRSFTGVIITIHLPHSQTLLCGSWGVHSLQGWEKPSYLGRLRQLWDGGDSWAKFFFLWDCKNESDNLLKSFNHRLFFLPKKIRNYSMNTCINLGSIKNVYYAFLKCFIGACILPESPEAWLGLGALEELAVIIRRSKRWIVNAEVERLCWSAEGFYCTRLPEATVGFYIVECDLPSFGKITLSLG